MIPILYEKNERTFNTTGLGFLPAWIEDTIEIVEERNGEFYLQGELPRGGLNVDHLAIDRIIFAEDQPFRIQRLEKPADSEKVKVLAHHVSYQLTESFVPPIGENIAPSTFSRAQDALEYLLHNADPDLSDIFSVWSDIVPSNALPFDVVGNPASVRNAIGGIEGSIIDVFGGELEWDRWTIKLHKARGSNTGKMVRYALNLETISYETDTSGLVTAYSGYYQMESGATVTGSLVLASNAGDYAYPRVQLVDLAETFGPGATPTPAEVTAATQAYCNAQKLHTLKTSIKVTADSEDLQDVHLCDTVLVIHPGYGLQQEAQIVKTVRDPIKEKYKELTIGEIQTDIIGTLTGLLRR